MENNQFKKASDVLKGLRKAEKNKPVESAADKAMSRRAALRKAQLDDIVPLRFCDGCERTKLSSRSWVIFPRAKLIGRQGAMSGRLKQQAGAINACCRHCWNRMLKEDAAARRDM